LNPNPETGLELILRAAAFAAEAHKKQKRKAENVPYVNHLIRVAHQAARAGLSTEAVAAALLHDVVEDTRATLNDLRRAFPERVTHLVHLLTQTWPDDARKEVKEREQPRYYAAILKDPEAVDLKLLDRADNLRDMVRVVPQARRWAESYRDRTRKELAPLYESCLNEAVRETYRSALKALEDALRR
jgi:GTP pyrophosphokinase